MRLPAVSPAGSAALAFAAYLTASVALFGREVLERPTSTVVGSFGGDQSFFLWSLVHWTRVLGADEHPFLTELIYAPDGFNVAWSTTIPGPALIAAPLTVTIGPVATYNVLALLAPALSALAAYLLARRLTGSTSAALAGGWLFGFSTYTVAQTLNHLNLALVWLVPLGVLLVLQRRDGDVRRGTFVALLGVVLVGQFLTFPEVFATMTVIGATGLSVGVALSSTRDRARLVGLVPEIAAAYGLALVVLSPYLYFMLAHPNPIEQGLAPGFYSLDLENLVVPTAVTALGGERFADRSSRFTGNLTEQLAYLGPVLPLLLPAAIVTLRRRRAAWVVLLTGVVALLAALGPRLVVGGVRGLVLPWAIALDLPLLRYVLPTRIVVFLWLAAALLVALWVAAPGRLRALRIVAVVVAAVTLLPSRAEVPGTGRTWWSTEMDAPSLFDGDRVRQTLERDETVLVLPFGFLGESMWWQASTGMWFRMASGYAASVLPEPYAAYPIVPTFLGADPPTDAAGELRRFLRDKRVTVVLVEARQGARWRPLLATLGVQPRLEGEMLVYDVPA